MVSMFKVIHYCQLMYLRTLKISVIKYANLQNSIEKAGLKKTKVKLDLLTDIVMLLMVEKV